MQSFTHDRYTEQPPSTWIGRHWLSTTRDGSGQYMRGVIIDIRPGSVRVQWPGAGAEPDTTVWTDTDRGTLARG
ncbi:hypothetical protein ACIA8O_00415 [Kitasatospora sp. NPDC051853]|uniref:hypothetical protein n=1 Tax=Kitasatospora sp. NPDC051853 TaxID=3364058 RepID=UPI0037A5E725